MGLALTLLVLSDFADYTDDTAAANDLALVTHPFYACSYFHRYRSIFLE